MTRLLLLALMSVVVVIVQTAATAQTPTPPAPVASSAPLTPWPADLTVSAKCSTDMSKRIAYLNSKIELEDWLTVESNGGMIAAFSDQCYLDYPHPYFQLLKGFGLVTYARGLYAYIINEPREYQADEMERNRHDILTHLIVGMKVVHSLDRYDMPPVVQQTHDRVLTMGQGILDGLYK